MMTRLDRGLGLGGLPPGTGVAAGSAIGLILVALTYRTRLFWSSVFTVGAFSSPVIGSKRGLSAVGIDGGLQHLDLAAEEDVDVVARLDQEVEAGDALDLEGDRLLARLELARDADGRRCRRARRPPGSPAIPR